MRNKMRVLLSCIIFTFFLITNKKIHSQNKLDEEILYISVNGLVCDFCARSIEKLFSKKDSVENIKINLEKMLITIHLKQGKYLDDETISKLIVDSGYNVREIKRGK